MGRTRHLLCGYSAPPFRRKYQEGGSAGPLLSIQHLGAKVHAHGIHNSGANAGSFGGRAIGAANPVVLD
jgi:hypothetical protein